MLRARITETITENEITKAFLMCKRLFSSNPEIEIRDMQSFFPLDLVVTRVPRQQATEGAGRDAYDIFSTHPH